MPLPEIGERVLVRLGRRHTSTADGDGGEVLSCRLPECGLPSWVEIAIPTFSVPEECKGQSPGEFRATVAAHRFTQNVHVYEFSGWEPEEVK